MFILAPSWRQNTIILLVLEIQASSKNSFVQVGGVSPKRRSRIYVANKFYYFTTPKIHLFYTL
ncbi:MAG: hypothetical protein LBP59_05305 [Planctomycetaceae bacterium]|nr:hypothetical protein [Planctomycetaceae bacterium]